MAEVVQLKLVEVGDAFEISPDVILENNKGRYQEVVVIGFGEDGVTVAGSHSCSKALWLIEKGKLELLG
jgi:hypothetical protein